MKKNTKKTTEKKYYIDPVKLSEEVRKSQQLKECTDELAKMILELNKRVINFPKFAKLPKDIKDELISHSNYRLLKKGIFSADPDNPKLFSYFTTAISLNCLNRLMKLTQMAAKEKQYKKEIYKDKLGWDWVDFSENGEQSENENI